MENETNINSTDNKELEDIFKLDYYEQNYTNYMPFFTSFTNDFDFNIFF